MNRDIVTVERLIAAPPEQIFDLIADTGGQQKIDGSGTVVGPRGESRRLRLGDTFGTDMKMRVPYATRSVVTEFEDNRLIAWRVLAKRVPASLALGRTWRYELEPVDGGTLVRETWDNTTEGVLSRVVTLRMAGPNKRGMTATLARIAELVE